MSIHSILDITGRVLWLLGKKTRQSTKWTMGILFNENYQIKDYDKSIKSSLIRTHSLIHPLITGCEIQMLSKNFSRAVLQ